ncbi:MAG: GNAT family N-acetyltransferase [Saprospiraceae bacterium]
MLNIQIANTPARLEKVKFLLWEYARFRNFDAALGDYEAEFNGLPGKYGPPDGSLVLATWEGQAAGCVAFKKLDENYCEMKRLYVSPSFRGKKIGFAMVERLLEEAILCRYQFMRLDSHPWMAVAQGIYQHFGFERIEAYNDNPTPGILFFEKRLILSVL